MDMTWLNRVRYTLYAPGYDWVAGVVRAGREQAFANLALVPGERVLIVGAGTGLDFEFVQEGAHVLATDLTPAMLERARARVRPGIELREMDGQALDLPDASFDVVVLHLIVAVIPDPVTCLREAARVLRPGGRISVFDKFVPDGEQPSLVRRALNLVTEPLFSNVILRFGDVLHAAEVPLEVLRDEPAGLGGTYRAILLKRTLT